MKYIDAEKLIKSVNNYREDAKAALNPIDGDADYYKGKIDVCENIQEFIAHLQQEQPIEGKQVVIITETDGDANIHWDCRSLDDVKALLASAQSFIADKQVEKLRGVGSGPDYNTTEGRFRNAHKFQQEQPEEKKLPCKRTRVNYAICKLQAFKPLREAIVLDDYVYDESKCYRENLVNYIHAIPENRLAEIRHYLKEKGWWPYDDDADWMVQEQPNNVIQWTGNNLKEVIDFTGKSPRFEEWFKSWDEFESYVHSHGDILKLFSEDGSHYEVPKGAWIVKTPDGYNLPSVAKYIHKEQPEVDLDEEITRFWKKEKESGKYIDTSFDTFVTLQHIAYHFANWQKEQDDKVKI